MPAPIISTVKRFSREKRFDVLIKKSTAGLGRGVFAFSKGKLPPSTSGGCTLIPKRFSTTSRRMR